MISSSLEDTSYWKSADPIKLPPSPNVTEPRRFRVSHPLVTTNNNPPSMTDSTANIQETMAVAANEARFILWVDAVGGFLVCPRSEVTLGQAVEQAQVDIPILGDLARRHLKIRRTPTGYVLYAFGPVSVNGIQCDTQVGSELDDAEALLLHDGDILELTGGIKIRFCKPHPLSASARLEFLSRHRTQPWSDGVLLMAESCVLGPNRRNHVVCRPWSEDLVFFQQQGQLYCKSLKPISVDGEQVSGKTQLTRNSRIEGEDFSMTIEPLSS